jgi:hypothetical protein
MDDFSISEDTIVTNTQTARTLRRADVVFLLDCTGTMKTILRAVTSAISEVVDLYSKSKVQIRLGLVEYRDTTQEADAHLNRMHFHTFAENSNFTRDIDEYIATMKILKAEGGGPLPESTYDALAHACNEGDWDSKADKILVLFSDAIPYRFGKIAENVCHLCGILQEKKIDQIHFVMNRGNDKILSKFTPILRCVPDVRDPRYTIFGNTYDIYAPGEDREAEDAEPSDFDHLKTVLLNIAKTSGDQAGGNTSGSQPYADQKSLRATHVQGCALDRMQKKSKKSRKNKPRTEPKPEPTPRDDGLVNRDNSATGNGNSNPYQ